MCRNKHKCAYTSQTLWPRTFSNVARVETAQNGTSNGNAEPCKLSALSILLRTPQSFDLGKAFIRHHITLVSVFGKYCVILKKTRYSWAAATLEPFYLGLAPSAATPAARSPLLETHSSFLSNSSCCTTNFTYTCDNDVTKTHTHSNQPDIVSGTIRHTFLTPCSAR